MYEKKSVGYASWKCTNLAVSRIENPYKESCNKKKDMIIMLERSSCVTTGGVHCFPPASMLLPWHFCYVLIMCAIDREVLWGSEPRQWSSRSVSLPLPHCVYIHFQNVTNSFFKLDWLCLINFSLSFFFCRCSHWCPDDSGADWVQIPGHRCTGTHLI